jgi:hypothetical protein
MALKSRNLFSRNRNPPVEENHESDSDSVSEDEYQPVKEKSKRPKENNFTQQRLKALHPIITPKYVIAIFTLLAIFLIPLGAGMAFGSYRVEDFTIDYTQCEVLGNGDYYTEIPDDQYTYNFHSDMTAKPQWKYVLDDSESDTVEQGRCRVQFQVPNDIGPAVYLLYKIENFYANHRRFAKSYSEDQIQGKAASLGTIKDTVGQNCQPLSENDDGVKYYPCGLIANALFNDTYTTPAPVNGTSSDFTMTTEGIAWATNKNRFQKTKYKPTEVVPPPNWIKKFPDGYTEENMPDISTWQEFQNWMQTPGLPTFSKLIMRNDNESMASGIYEVEVGLHWPVRPFDGKKSLYLTTRSVIGGRNPFLGISWIVCGGLCLIIGLVFLIINIVKPRKMGDVSKLSWNQQE